MAEPGTGVGRRHVTLGAAALALSAAAPARAAVTPTVATDAGKVSGLGHGDVCVFKGIPYAASTAGTARFMPPAPAKPWTDIRPAVEYGPKSPQAPGVRGPGGERRVDAFRTHVMAGLDPATHAARRIAFERALTRAVAG